MIVNCSNGRRVQIATTGNLTGLQIESLTLDIRDVRDILGMDNANMRNHLEGLLYRFVYPKGVDMGKDQLGDTKNKTLGLSEEEKRSRDLTLSYVFEDPYMQAR